MKYERGSTQTKRTKHGTTSNMTSAKLTLNSEKQEVRFMNLASTTQTPLWTRLLRAFKSTKTSTQLQTHNTLPNSRPLTRPTPRWSQRCRLSFPKSRPYSSLTLPTTEVIMSADAALVGAVDVHDRQPHPHQSTAGPTVTTETTAKSAHTMLMDTRRRRPLHT